MHQDESNRFAIVADIGGTFARFARVSLDSLALDTIEIFRCSDYSNLEYALRAYQDHNLLHSLRNIAVAIACPVIGDYIHMTNCQWNFSIAQVKEKMQLDELHVINDFSAIAASLGALRFDELFQIDRATQDSNKAKVVLGAGTGLGVACSISKGVTIAGEGGHVEWSATNDQEWYIYQYLNKKYGHVSQERVLSGQGLENLYTALHQMHHNEVHPLTAAQIISAALERTDSIAESAVDQFFASLGSYAGDLALTMSAFGGVYLAGGIVPRLLPLIEGSRFRSRFEAKGRFSELNKKVPTFVITAEQPGLLGAAVYLQQSVQGAPHVVC